MLPPSVGPKVMTVHSASLASPRARGTRYSATRIGLDAGRRRQRDGSAQRNPGPGIDVDGDAVLELEAGWAGGLEAAFGLGESSSGADREHPGRAVRRALSPRHT